MTKQTIEIDVPEGMRVGNVAQSQMEPHVIGVVVSFTPIPPATKRRPTTKFDLLGVDSLPCWVRNDPESEWKKARVIAVASSQSRPYIGIAGRYRFAEIEVPDDEQPLLECWVDYFPKRKDPWGASWPDPFKASGVAKHMIEVREPKT